MKPEKHKPRKTKDPVSRPARPQKRGGDPASVGASQSTPERVAKRIARAGLCSRREAERWIGEGRVRVNGKVLDTPAVVVSETDLVEVDGAPIPKHERTRLWLFHKAQGLITTSKDPEGRKTVFEVLPTSLPRVVSVGRLDINTEGLLLLTNDGGLARTLELPSTGWSRKYRVRVFGKIDTLQLDSLKDGIAVDGVLYGAIEAKLDRQEGANAWLTLVLREGKNREVKRVLGALGLEVNRLIRVSYGPFQLGDLQSGEVREVRGRLLRDQLGEKLIAASNANFEAPILHHTADVTTRSPRKNRDPKAKATQKKVPKGQAKPENLNRLETSKGPKKRAAHRSGGKGNRNRPSFSKAKSRTAPGRSER